jgi:hypothetical protein
VNAASGVPGPARFRELAQEAEALATAIGQAHSGLRASDEEFIRRSGFRLEDAAGAARGVASELRDTASDLDRFAARPADACEIPWGACPEHGGTLTSTGGRTTCQACGRTWDYDRLTMPCEEPARWILTDSGGDSSRVCDGHACDARTRLEGARLTRLPDSNSEGGPR